ncbi:MAG: hypothetical protein R2851_16735 [Caldilineaceae bacterium]
MKPKGATCSALPRQRPSSSWKARRVRRRHRPQRGLHSIIDPAGNFEIPCKQTGNFNRANGLCDRDLSGRPNPDAIVAANVVAHGAGNATEAAKAVGLSVRIIGYGALPGAPGHPGGRPLAPVEQFPGEQVRTAPHGETITSARPGERRDLHHPQADHPGQHRPNRTRRRISRNTTVQARPHRGQADGAPRKRSWQVKSQTKLIASALAAGGVLLAPTWVPRSFCIPGGASSSIRDCARSACTAAASTSAGSRHHQADNGPQTTPDEGLSYVVYTDGSATHKLLLARTWLRSWGATPGRYPVGRHGRK